MTGGELLQRADKSTGQQNYETDPDKYPLTQPLPKLDSRKQTAGEAQYVGDLPAMTGQLHAVFVKSTVASADVKSIDTSKAEAAPGVNRSVYLNHSHYLNEIMSGFLRITAYQTLIP